ncbi:MAG: 3'(2'),5'-bisphosphate nucleotidase CysQ [Desulfobacterales bacterium]|mgnify:FL=1|jgi:3'(2'), 5'-bisphosphate nucleotidase|nr:3'(2'),5'-bisphosphate nucleotidase CysQ [Desulfobacteraceae bacterium]MBT4364830.1 3'(2'),5'-bisphosphate nucleotidase CysQ [Desulfobacteraceae bacterium]MBT7086550.1 3'(2'),5'-bisphosphate nucleotidase CysQ [Desulfobacterales bacterium]MBT7695941.1 3'(2'),5'-bisphosphate nucleotidase CysQ [Desulfobacterales bacterium]
MKSYLLKSIQASLSAGKAILEVYSTDFKIELKSDDSPLTTADKLSHKIIKSYLSKFHIPILSEEGKDVSYEERKNWDTLWIVDPIDGTKEFIKRNGEFTVNIALVKNGKPVLGVLLVPVKNTLYFAMQGIGSYKLDIDYSDTFQELSLDEIINRSEQLEKKPIKENSSHSEPYKIVGSRSHPTPELSKFVETKRQEKGNVEFISAGSSLKFCLIAEGKADIYPRLGPTREWDTAAGHAIAEYAGATILIHGSDKPLVYNKQDLLNPWFVVC